MFAAADLVVKASVSSSRRWLEGQETLHLVAQYRVAELFKGEIEPGEIIIATYTCLDESRPPQRAGYRSATSYCPGGYGLSLTGVDPLDGNPVRVSADDLPEWNLFLAEDPRRGPKQRTWVELPRTSYHGGCDQTREDLPEGDRQALDRFLEAFQESSDW